MRKLFLPFLPIFILSFFSCEKQADETKDVDFSKMKLNLQRTIPEEAIILAYYSDIDDLQKQVETIAGILIDDSTEYLNENNHVTNVITKINFSNGKAIVTELFYVNLDTEEIIEGYVLDENTGTYQKVDPLGAGYGEYVNGSCPSGYTQLASCSNTSNPQGCVADAIETFFGANLTAVGHCANVQVSIALLNTKVCGKKC